MTTGPTGNTGPVPEGAPFTGYLNGKLEVDHQPNSDAERAILAIPDLPTAIAEIKALVSAAADTLQERISSGEYLGTELVALAVMSVCSRMVTESFHPVAGAIDLEGRKSDAVLRAVMAALQEGRDLMEAQARERRHTDGGYL